MLTEPGSVIKDIQEIYLALILGAWFGELPRTFAWKTHTDTYSIS
jgi:hypothetical protein